MVGLKPIVGSFGAKVHGDNVSTIPANANKTTKRRNYLISIVICLRSKNILGTEGNDLILFPQLMPDSHPGEFASQALGSGGMQRLPSFNIKDSITLSVLSLSLIWN